MILRSITVLMAVIILLLTFPGQDLNNETMKNQHQSAPSEITIFLCGDVMTGRGLGQIMPHSVDPAIYESYVKDARDYERLAEIVNGPIDKLVSWTYIWGDALRIWKLMSPACRIINLETAITTRNLPWPGKGINYRMHPGNFLFHPR